MEVETNIVVLGVLQGMEIVPPPCIDMGVYMLVTLVVDVVLPTVVIKVIDVCGPGLKGL